MKQLLLVVLLALGIVGPVLATPTPVNPFGPVEAGRCIGVKPIKPIKPIGCKELELLCTCDAQGNRCDWEWVCIGQ